MTELWHHVDHPDDERFDLVEIEVEPRWKESELSGDEWRFSYIVKATRKGQVIIRRSYSRLDWAINALHATLNMWPADEAKGFDREAWERTKTKCDQPGCANEATVFYKRLKRYTHGGDELMPGYASEYRQFCEGHKERGDCALDDADHNYERLPGRPS